MKGSHALALHLLVVLVALVAGLELILAEIFFHQGLVLGYFSIGHAGRSIRGVGQ
jgi:hypothetical protein